VLLFFLSEKNASSSYVLLKELPKKKEKIVLANMFKQITKTVLQGMSVCWDLKGQLEHPVLWRLDYISWLTSWPITRRKTPKKNPRRPTYKDQIGLLSNVSVSFDF